MRLCFIKNENSNSNEYLVDCTLLHSLIRKGSTIYLDNKIVKKAYLTSGIIEISQKQYKDLGLVEKFGEHKTLMKIGTNLKKLSLEEIIISDKFSKKIPDINKISNCMQHYKDTKKLDRIIAINNNKVLKDGYIAYLVAKMFDLKRVDVVQIWQDI